MQINKLAVFAILVASIGGVAQAHDAPPGFAPGQERPGRGLGVGGQITAIDGATFTLQTFRGETAKVKITSSTRFMKDRQEAKVSDFKVGDWVFAAGEQGKDGAWTAQMLRARSGGGEGRAGAMRGQPGGDGMRAKPEDNGKSYILGTITKIDGTKLTVKKPDNTEQVIEVSDDTSFRNERRESVTLADVKAGDFVRGQGELKGGVFVPRELTAGVPRGPRPGMPLGTQAGSQQESSSQPQSQPQSQAPDGGPQVQNQAAPDSSDQNK
jgi:hypothetical protein